MGKAVGVPLGDAVGTTLEGNTLGVWVGLALGDAVGAMLEGDTLGCSVRVALGDAVGAMLEGDTLGCLVRVALGDNVTMDGTKVRYNSGSYSVCTYMALERRIVPANHLDLTR